MSEIDLVLVNETDNCTIYTLQFESKSETEFESFFNKFRDDAVYNPDLMRIVAFINKNASDKESNVVKSETAIIECKKGKSFDLAQKQ